MVDDVKAAEDGLVGVKVQDIVQALNQYVDNYSDWWDDQVNGAKTPSLRRQLEAWEEKIGVPGHPVLAPEAVKDFVRFVDQGSIDFLTHEPDSRENKLYAEAKEIVQRVVQNLPDASFSYQLLVRLQQDCDYYLGAGNRSAKHLWALDEVAQIEKMQELYDQLPEKPEWLSLEQIEQYKTQMLRVPEVEVSNDRKVLKIDSVCTNNEPLASLPGSVVRLNGESRMVEVVKGNEGTMSFGGKPAIKAFAADVGLSEADAKRMFSLEALANALGKSGKAIDDVLVVTDGRHVGPVLGMKDGKALIDAGRGNLVGLDTTTLEKPPKPGDKVDVSLAGGVVKAFKNLGDELSKDGQAVSVSMHTGR